MAKSAQMFATKRDYIGLDITITDNYGVKTRVIRNAIYNNGENAIYNNGEDDLYILMNEFKRALIAADYLSSSVNRIQYLEADEMEKAKAAGIVIGTIDD